MSDNPPLEDSVRRLVTAVERLADNFAPDVPPAAKDAAVRAVEAWDDYSAGRAGQEPFLFALAAYQRAKRGR